jgi:hypothetical protein
MAVILFKLRKPEAVLPLYCQIGVQHVQGNTAFKHGGHAANACGFAPILTEFSGLHDRGTIRSLA